MNCKHDKGMDYVVRDDGVYMVCRKCQKVMGRATKFEQVDTPNLFRQKDEPRVMGK
jgi:hypothetical protein